MESYRWDLNLKVRLFGEGLFNLLFWMYFPFITVYFAQTLGVELAGLLMAVPPLFLLIGSLIGGSLADEIGRRPVMLVGTFAQGVLFLAFAVSTNAYVDYVTYIGIGFMGAIYKPASSAMVLGHGRRPRANRTFTRRVRDVHGVEQYRRRARSDPWGGPLLRASPSAPIRLCLRPVRIRHAARGAHP